MEYRVLQICGTSNRKFLPNQTVDVADWPATLDVDALIAAGVIEAIGGTAQEAPVAPAVDAGVVSEILNEEVP